MIQIKVKLNFTFVLKKLLLIFVKKKNAELNIKSLGSPTPHALMTVIIAEAVASQTSWISFITSEDITQI